VGVGELCSSCAAPLTGAYCATCGQPRFAGRLTLRSFGADVLRRVFRFDRAFAVTVWRMLREPGRLVPDYLEGRRAGYLDPIHYLVSCVFVQLLVVSFTRLVAPALGRTSAYGWLGQLGGVLALKVLTIFWMGTLWRLMFRPRRYNLAEIYVFAIYAFATSGLLCALPPLLDLAVPYPLGSDPLLVLTVMLSVEVVYLSYATWKLSGLPAWESAVRVTLVLGAGYALLIALMGPEQVAGVLLPAQRIER
jgi:uncharacterized protein DUF3667